ncbi:SDR family NAD(P)-dependent oxidoreductase [Devosia soli]|uniref:SDR family NAD(P)-dependent oxidoreductase n=1 Tax=Devosia soli TaxID=361041 RepID=UPI00061EFE49|nr:SDR family NAD(P)-dependent oxidoreductase [Devosia soli]
MCSGQGLRGRVDQQSVSLPIHGKRAIVTGGSRGIGAAIVRKCAEQGATIAFTYSADAEVA